MLVLVYLGIIALALWGFVALASKREMTDEEYEARKEAGGGLGNALVRGAAEGLAVAQGLFEPGREKVIEAKKGETEEGEDAGGDPPDPANSGTRGNRPA